MRTLLRHQSWRPLSVAIGVWLLFFGAACNRRVADDGGDPGKESLSEEAAKEEDQIASHLKTLTAAPWLGHADDGSLVKIEFFVGKDETSTVCRSTVTSSIGSARPQKSPFTATEDLAEVIWDKGRNRASYSAETKSLDATFASPLGVHRVTLEQVTVAERPELATYSKSVPESEAAWKAHEKVVAMLEKGKRWWSSGAAWTELVSPDALEPADQIVLIRPDGVKPIKLPVPKVGEAIEIPLFCHLTPGAATPDGQGTVGVVAQLHSAGNAQSSWMLYSLNPGAQKQKLTARWQGSTAEELPSGTGTFYVYLTKPKDVGDKTVVDVNAPISNLLKVEIEFGADAEAEPEPDGEGEAEAESE